METAAFLVRDWPYAVWDVDLAEKNAEFIRGIDPTYYDYLVEAHSAHLESNNRQQAAVAMRAAYHHAQETLFTLLCAAVQAPSCVPGWIQKCTTEQLRSLVQEITEERCTAGNFLGLASVTWQGISDKVNLFAYQPPRLAETRRGFADFWRMLARDWLGIDHIEEYRALKHGFRVQSGGVTLFVGVEQERGVAAPQDSMGLVGGSEFGTSFLVQAQFEGAPPGSDKFHFRLRRQSVNWTPEAIESALRLVSMSIGNVKSFLRIYNRESAASTVQFTRPQDIEAFELPWSDGPGVSTLSIDTVVHEKHVTRRTAAELRRHIAAKMEPMKGRWRQAE